ncbi:MAG TPA: sigma-70 family RNA polymerase sigma factor [Phycisphaerae bacterium]|nr:sigma-70 family RNA polymerase sigma factor [Phycisphaerae bacterium]
MTGQTGDSEDVERLLVAFSPRVYGLLLRMVGRSDVAEDLMQETLLRAFRSLGTYRSEGKFRAWIFRIAVNLARDWIRRRPREPATGLDDDAAAAPAQAVLARDVPPEADALGRERRRDVEQALARLPDADREVLLMRYYGDLTFKAIARATGEPLGTVLARAHRALRKLGDLIPEESHEPLP